MSEHSADHHKRKREPLAKGVAERWVCVWVDRHEVEIDVPKGLNEEDRKKHVMMELAARNIAGQDVVALYVDQERRGHNLRVVGR